MLPVLILAPRGRDALVVYGVLHAAGMPAQVCPDLAAVTAALTGCSAVVVTEEALAGPAPAGDAGGGSSASRPGPTWRSSCCPPSRARRPHRGASAILEQLGNAVLLERPLNAESLVSAARTALRARRGSLRCGT